MKGSICEVKLFDVRRRWSHLDNNHNYAIESKGKKWFFLVIEKKDISINLEYTVFVNDYLINSNLSNTQLSRIHICI